MRNHSPLEFRAATLAGADCSKHRSEWQLLARSREGIKFLQNVPVAGEELVEHKPTLPLERQPRARALEVARPRHRVVARVGRVMLVTACVVHGHDAAVEAREGACNRVDVAGLV
jgi:hypothetical protein